MVLDDNNSQIGIEFASRKPIYIGHGYCPVNNFDLPLCFRHGLYILVSLDANAIPIWLLLSSRTINVNFYNSTF